MDFFSNGLSYYYNLPKGVVEKIHGVENVVINEGFFNLTKFYQEKE
jgi:hypothetical protein